MKKEDSRVGKRDVPATPSANVSTDKFARTSASANVQPSHSAPPAALIPLMMSTKTIVVICLSFAKTYSALLVRNSISRFSNALLVFLHNRRRSRNNTNIWHQAHSWCRLVNRQFPLRWTWHTLCDKGGQSTLRTCHSDSMQDVANGLMS